MPVIRVCSYNSKKKMF